MKICGHCQKECKHEKGLHYQDLSLWKESSVIRWYGKKMDYLHNRCMNEIDAERFKKIKIRIVAV